MSQSTPNGIVLAAAVFVCVILVPWAIKSLLAFGGAPEESGVTVLYRIKPMMRVILWVIALSGLAAVWSGVGDVRNDRMASGFLLIVIGLAGMGLLVMGQSEIILDRTGIHIRTAFFRESAPVILHSIQLTLCAEYKPIIH